MRVKRASEASEGPVPGGFSPDRRAEKRVEWNGTAAGCDTGRTKSEVNRPDPITSLSIRPAGG